jgi:aldehyde:ferredoxin oxidoreductase
VPPDNKQTKEPAKVMQHVEWYAQYFGAVTGRKVAPDDLITMSERVYNFQRVFCVKMGYGKREHDAIPYRAMGPVTKEEYESRQERYDKQLKEIHGVDIDGKETAEKVKILRTMREQRYEELKDAVYARRGWTRDGIPTLETVKRLGIDFPEVIDVLKTHGVV